MGIALNASPGIPPNGPGAYGRITAAPLTFRLFALLPPDSQSPPAPPPEQPLATLSPSLQVFGARSAFAAAPSSPRILFPPAGAVLQITQDGSINPISLEAAGGVPPYRWFINGTMLPAAPVGMSMTWQPDSQGFAHISVLDAQDAAATEDIDLQ